MVLFEKRGREGRAKGATQSEYDLEDPALEGLIEADLLEQLREEVELLQVRGGGQAGSGGQAGRRPEEGGGDGRSAQCGQAFMRARGSSARP